jgi:hypothetical protein
VEPGGAAGIGDLNGMMRALTELETPYGLAWYGDLHVMKLMEAAGPEGGART